MLKREEYNGIIDEFENRVGVWRKEYGRQVREQLEAFDYAYDIDREIVFNQDLRCDPSKVRHILVGDNPGENEQREERYLIGRAGAMARNFHEREFGLDFAESVLVLNKTPIHTKLTGDLGRLDLPDRLFDETQIYMGELAVNLMELLGCELWITGMSHLNKMFAPFVDAVKAGTEGRPELREKVLVFKHFSRGLFKGDLNREMEKSSGSGNLNEALVEIGRRHRLAKLGF